MVRAGSGPEGHETPAACRVSMGSGQESTFKL